MVAAGLAGVFLLATPALAGESIRYEGRSDQKQRVDLITNGKDVVIRGALAYEAPCSNGYRPTENRIRFNEPNRSSRSGFREAEKFVLKTDSRRFKARYRYEIVGTRVNANRIEGTLEVVTRFYEDGERYTTCRSDEVDYKVRRGEPPAR